jgi:hypothetical protein
MLCTTEKLRLEPKPVYFPIWSVPGNYVSSRPKEGQVPEMFIVYLFSVFETS